MQQKIVHVDSKAFPVEVIFKDRYEVDFYQREYVWEHKQIEDLISDLTNEFLKNWKPGDTTQDTLRYAPYFMGEIVLAEKESGTFAVIDGQQRLTSFMLLMIFLRQRFGSVPGFPSSDLSNLIYANVRGDAVFKLDIPERRECMLSLFNDGAYILKSNDSISVRNLVERYQDIANCWDDDINESNVNHFAYWLMGNITFSKIDNENYGFDEWRGAEYDKDVYDNFNGYRPTYIGAQKQSNIKVSANQTKGVRFITERGVPIIAQNDTLQLTIGTTGK